MTADSAYARLVAANPVEDPERYLAELVDLERSLRRFEEDVMTDEGVLASQIASSRSPRLYAAVAAFAAVLVLAVPIWLALAGREPAVGGDPIEVVDAFFDRWNRGDVDAALALVDPEVAVNSGLQEWSDLRGLMLFAAQFDAEMEAACGPLAEEETLNCAWAWRSASAEALGAGGAQQSRFVVTDGLIAAMSTPNYGAVERALSEFAREADSAGYSAACAPDGESPRSASGFVFNEQCGRFLAGLELAFVSSLEK